MRLGPALKIAGYAASLRAKQRMSCMQTKITNHESPPKKMKRNKQHNVQSNINENNVTKNKREIKKETDENHTQETPITSSFNSMETD